MAKQEVRNVSVAFPRVVVKKLKQMAAREGIPMWRFVCEKLNIEQPIDKPRAGGKRPGAGRPKGAYV